MRKQSASILLFALVGCNYQPCPKDKEDVDVNPWRGIKFVACSCAYERTQDPHDVCCGKKGGICEDQEHIPAYRRSWSPSSGPLVAVAQYEVRGVEHINPYECEPLFAYWTYANIQNGPIGSSSDIGLEPVWTMRGPFETEGPGQGPIVDQVLAPWSAMTAGQGHNAQWNLEGKTDGMYDTQIEGLPPYTPGTAYQNVDISGENDDYDSFDCF